MAAKVMVTGIRDIDRRLRRLEPRVGRKVIRQAIRASLKPVVAEAKEAAPKDTGTLAKSIKIVAPKKRRVGVIRLVVRAMPPKNKGLLVKNKKGEWKETAQYKFYGGFVEYGTKKQEGQEYMKLTFQNSADETRDHCIALIREGLDRAIRER